MVTSNAINLSQVGVVSYDGVGDFTGSVLTQHDVLVGGSANAITSVTPSTAGFVLTSNGTGADPSFKSTIALTPLVVNPTAGAGNYQTITAAMAAAVSGQDIFVTTGTYTENFTLTPGVNITAFGCDGSQDGTGHVTIVGKVTMTGAGTCTLYGLQIETNSDYCIEVTGSSACSLNLTNCYINCSNNTGIHFTNSNAASFISMQECNGDVGTTGISVFTSTSSGALFIQGCYFTNTGVSITSSTLSAGSLFISFSVFNHAITTSGTAALTIETSSLGVTNTTLITANGTNNGFISSSTLNSGTASTISVGSGVIIGLNACVIGSSNTNAITGSGAISIAYTLFSGTSRNINTTTINGASAQGIVGASPTTGAIGEQIKINIPNSSAVNIPNNSATNIISFNLSPGTWDVSAILGFITPGAITGNGLIAAISTTSGNIGGTLGDGSAGSTAFPSSIADSSITIPSFRIFVTTTTPIYLVGFATFSVGTIGGYGRLSATRVG